MTLSHGCGPLLLLVLDYKMVSILLAFADISLNCMTMFFEHHEKNSLGYSMQVVFHFLTLGWGGFVSLLD